MTGVILCGFGFGGMVFGLAATEVVNPDNLPVRDPRVFMRVPLMLRVMAGIYLFIGVLGIVLIFPPAKNDTYREFEKSQDN